ncbi:MAG: hypothetical protein ACXWXF_13050, partial [Aeromicrobium sp.]
MRAFNALFGLLLLGSLVAGGCESEAPEATVDPALAVALQPACAGDAVVGAGLVATITTAPNHVVVLDVGGALSEFARAMPAAW